MMVGIDWTDIHNYHEKDQVIAQVEQAGFTFADSDNLDPFDDRKTSFIGDDMLILDIENKKMWTGDWGTYVDIEVGLNFARFLGHKRFDTDD